MRYLFATEEQLSLADEARKLLEKELAPRLSELEQSETYPQDVHKKLAELGYCCMDIPEELGGLGMDFVTRCIIYEEMAKVDAGFTFSFLANSWDFILKTSLPEDEKKALIGKCMAGDLVVSMGLTEADAGSDALAMRTTAVKDGDEWVLNGTKCFISNAPHAGLHGVVAYNDKSLSSRGTTMFLVRKDTPGFSIGKKEEKMGFRLSPTAELVLDNVRVPEAYIVGKVGEGFKHAMAAITEARVSTMMTALGMSQAALDYAIEYSKQRRQRGLRIIDHQGLGFLIAEMQIRVNSARALIYYAAEAIKRGIDIGTMSSEVKIQLADMVMSVTTDAVQVLGGYGYMRDYPTEKWMRDAKLYGLFEGTNQINKNVIAKAIAGKDPLSGK